MKLKLIEKYIGNKKKKKEPKAPEGYEWTGKSWKPKRKKKVNESSPYGSSEMWFGAWNKRSMIIYVRNEEVLFSSTGEFPTGSSMTEEDRKRASARGYILLDW